jgi:hypothetical protein
MVGVLFFGVVANFCMVYAESSMSKLPPPELVSVTYEDHSYTVPASTSIDPFTGKTVENPAYRVDNRKLTIVINKKALDTTDSYIYYKIRMKGSFSTEWVIITDKIVPASNSALTTLVFTSFPPEIEGHEGKLSSTGGFYGTFDLPFEGKADFQVYVEQWGLKTIPGGMMPGTNSYTDVLVSTSDWSNIKTITMGNLNGETPNSSSSGQNSVSSNQSGEQSEGIIAGLSLVECGLLATVVIMTLLLIAVTFFYRRKISLNLSEKQPYHKICL